METKIVENIKLCAKAINDGETVAFGTETVYGLGADCFNDDAVAKIFEAKGRPSGNPLIIHVCSIEQAQTVAAEWTDRTDALARNFWPGSLTLVVKKSDKVSDLVSGGKDTVGIRMPGGFYTQQFIKECGVPLVAPSANLSGRPSPTTAEQVYKDMNGRVRYILDFGPTITGIESTVYDVANKTIIRPGVVPREDIEKVDGKINRGNDGKEQYAQDLFTHYNPSYKVVLVDGNAVEEKIGELCDEYGKANTKYAIIDINGEFKNLRNNVISFNGDLPKFATGLYSLLLEQEGKTDVLVFGGIEKKGLGEAVMDRLEKASGNNIIHT